MSAALYSYGSKLPYLFVFFRPGKTEQTSESRRKLKNGLRTPKPITSRLPTHFLLGFTVGDSFFYKHLLRVLPFPTLSVGLKLIFNSFKKVLVNLKVFLDLRSISFEVFKIMNVNF